MVKASSIEQNVDFIIPNFYHVMCRVLALMKESASLFNREEFMRRKKMLATHEYSTQHNLEATITEGKVEGSVMVNTDSYR